MKREIRQLLLNVRRTLRVMWHIDRLNFGLYALFAIVQVIASLLTLYFGSRVLGSLFSVLGSASGSRSSVFWYLGLSVASGTLEQVSWRCLSYFEGRSYLIWHTQLAPHFNGKVSRLDLEHFENPEFNKLLNKVIQDYNWKPANFTYYILHLFHAAMRIIGATAVLIGFAPWMLPILLLAVIPSMIVESRQSKIKWDIWGEKGDTSRRYYKLTYMMQQKADVMELRIFGLNDYFISITRKLLNDFNREQQRVLGKFFVPAVVTRIVEGALVGGLNLWLIFGVLNRRFGIQQYSFYSGAIQQFNSSVSLLLSSLGSLYEYSLFMTDYYRVMDTPSLLPAPAEPYSLSKAVVPRIEFKDVSFKYASSNTYVFKHLNLIIEPGERIALVGENGVGKSTLIKLLLRYYDVSSGSILIDNHDVRDLDLNSWYRLVGVLFQDFGRYPFTVGDNIWLGRISRPKDQRRVETAAKLAGIAPAAANYPHGFDTILDNSFEEGVEPSGGQWQRVALARAFYRQAPVLILDEPTAAIDAKAEYEIFNNIFQEHAGRTAIIVSHRFSTVRKADRIIVFKKGVVTETGTHKELMKKGGLYHEMFSKQAEGYKD